MSNGTKGTIEEVSTNKECRQFCAKIAESGFEDDRSETPGILLMNAEVPHRLNVEFGQQIMAGELGDNILARGLINLTTLPPGTIIQIEEKVELIVRAKADHYRKKFPHYSEEMLAYLEEWGGTICFVKKGIGTLVCDDQTISIVYVS